MNFQERIKMNTKTGKPKCKLVGCDGNVFSIIGSVIRSLRKAGLIEKAEEFREKAMRQESYDDVLILCFEYVDVY